MLPLSFDRVMDGQPITSSLPIFRLPIELINHITLYFSPTDLASFALVDRDCRQLARSIQFCDLRMDRDGDAFLEFLELLEAESRDRKNAITLPRFTIGSCVRRVYTHYGPWEYLDRVCVVIRDALPNLCRLDWETAATMSSEMFHCFTSIPLKHLGLKNVRLDHALEVQWARNMRPWALESLVLFVTCYSESDSGVSDEDAVPFTMSLLYQAAPTLSNLVWIGRIDQPYTHSFSESPPCFPNLRDLTLDAIRIDEIVLTALLGPQSCVTSLTVSACHQEMGPFLKSRGCLSSLTHINWISGGLNDHSSMISFIGDNTQLQSLTTTCGLPSATLDRLLPILSRFRELTTLQLTWDEDHIRSESLQLIGSIASLKHLWLSADSRSEWRRTWQVNHVDLAEALFPLTSLETLFLVGDTYATDVHPMLDRPEAYYASRTLPQTVDTTQYFSTEDRVLLESTRDSPERALGPRSQILCRAWEEWHLERMTAFAAQYARRPSQMRLFYLGQISFKYYGDRTVTSTRGETWPQLGKLWQQAVGISAYGY
ncbi:hypothetical protein BD779DRAFT_309311 [Infundibulicybe gibba]|nr:hypothetical protein BD779DRAFT_309311 [Infundibulicybe gibba]